MDPLSNASSPYFDYSSGYKDIISDLILPQLKLQELAEFLLVSRSCYLFRKIFFDKIINSEIATKMIHRDGCYKSTRLEETLKSSPICCSVSKLDIFFHIKVENPAASLELTFLEVYHIDLAAKKAKAKNEFDLARHAKSIEKIIVCNDSIHFLCNIPKMISYKSIITTPKKYESKKLEKEMNKITVPSFDLMEADGNMLFTNDGSGKVNIYDWKSPGKINTLNFEVVDRNERIVGMKIDNNLLFVRFAHGFMSIVDLQSLRIIHTVECPNCKESDEHFEVRGNYFFTAQDWTVTKWEFNYQDSIPMAVGQINYCCENDFIEAKSTKFSFSLDGPVIYLGTNSVQAWDCDSLNYYGRYYSSKNLGGWKFKKFFVKEGVMVALLGKNDKYTYDITNFNSHNMKSKVEFDQPVQKKKWYNIKIF